MKWAMEPNPKTGLKQTWSGSGLHHGLPLEGGVTTFKGIPLTVWLNKNKYSKPDVISVKYAIIRERYGYWYVQNNYQN